MRVLMLGWEFPPLITGGLGTAHALASPALLLIKVWKSTLCCRVQ